jgi:hypothetical protein
MFRYSICDPLKPDPMEMGEIEKEKILDILDRLPWTDLLNKMKGVDESDIHYSPTLEVENKANNHLLSISIVLESNGEEFYVFYTRPKTVTSFFGLIKNTDDHFYSERTGQTIKEVRDAVKALISGDILTLEKRWG